MSRKARKQKKIAALQTEAPRHVQKEKRELPSLLLSGQAYLKMKYCAHNFPTEVGGFCEAFENQPFQIATAKILPQESTAASIDFTDDGIVAYMEDGAEKFKGDLNRFFRVWWHTHPGMSAVPSSTDMATFYSLTRTLPWVIMLIVGTEQGISARYGTIVDGIFLHVPMTVDVKWDLHIYEDWDKEYAENVTKPAISAIVHHHGSSYPPYFFDGDDDDQILIQRSRRRLAQSQKEQKKDEEKAWSQFVDWSDREAEQIKQQWGITKWDDLDEEDWKALKDMTT